MRLFKNVVALFACCSVMAIGANQDSGRVSWVFDNSQSVNLAYSD